MKTGFRVSALVLCAAVLLSFAACGGHKTSSAKSSKTSSGAAQTASGTAVQVPDGFILPVALDKSLDPLTTDTMNNLVLWPLMYDSLVEPDQNFTPLMGLASSIDNSGTTVTVHLKNPVLFSDGTQLTSRDVVYSYNLVMQTPASFFYSNVSNIDSVEQSGSAAVVFHLKTPDPLFTNLLVLPVIKSKTDQNNDNYQRTGINIPPIGSGRYIFSTDAFKGTLSCNKNWYGGGTPTFKTISLVNMLNGSTSLSSLKVGGINYLFTDYGNGATASVGLGTASVYMNRMVYMGFNSARPGLSDAAVRSAVSLAVNRKTIVSNAFSSKAAAACLPFNPAWAGVAKPTNAQITPDYTLAQSRLSEEGFSTLNSGGALTGTIDGTAVTLSYKLLVDRGNSVLLSAAKEITSDLNKIGITVTLDAEPSDVFNTDLAQNNFDLYLGQINLNDDMDLTPLLSEGGSAAYGTPQPGSTLSAFNAWRAGTGSLTEIVEAFGAETPLVPICYRYGTVSFTKGLKGSISPTYYDIFRGIADWHF